MQIKRLSILGFSLVAIVGTMLFWGVMEPHKKSKGKVLGDEYSIEDVASRPVYFFRSECPHCQNVGAFLEGNGLGERLGVMKLEVGNSEKNAAILKEKSKECSLDESELGVPFLYFQGNCFLGDENVIAALKQIEQGQ